MLKRDIRYIIKKILIYSGVAIILMFVKSCDIKALTQSAVIGSYGDSINITANNYENNTFVTDGINARSAFVNYGEGNVIFNVVATNGGQAVDQIQSIIIENDRDQFICNIGSFTTYTDSTTQRALYTVDCPVNFTNGYGFKRIRIKRSDIYGILVATYSPIATFVSKDSPNDYQALINALDNQTNIIASTINNNNTTQAINNINDTITNDNVDNQQSSDFFNNFGSTTNEGLQDLIKKPIGIINSFYNTCSPITFDIPYFDTTITLPCISSIQNDFTSVIFPIIRVIINGLLCYRILTKFIDVINKLKDPNNSDLEVVDL